MAQQKGIIKLEGTIGDITFYKSQDGYLAKGKSGVSKERISTDEAFQRTRENNSEFGRAGSAGKMLRDALRNFIQNGADSRMTSRLTQEMVEVIKADTTSTRGERNVLDGELELLEGFEFNGSSKLGTTFYAPYMASIDRVSGTAAVNIPSFIPGNVIAAPSGATHFKLVAAGAEVNFEDGTYNAVGVDSGELPIDYTPTAVIDLSNALTPNSDKPLFLLFGIEFYQEVNGVKYTLRSGAYNALCLVKVLGL